MKRFFIFLTVLLSLAGCTQKPSATVEEYAMPADTLIVVDHPVAVLIDPGQNDSKDNAGRLLNALDVPMISSSRGPIEFIKSNGDKVQLDIQPLKGSYDLILFNAVNDPVLCSFTDLDKLIQSYFRTSVKSLQPVAPGSGYPIAETNQPDTLRQTRQTGTLQKNAEKPKKITITSRNKLDIPFYKRKFPGIQLVEQILDERRSLTVTFENDLITYANTDRYFTNGITIQVQSPRWAGLRISSWMIPYRKPSTVSYSLILVQNMYTPTDTRVAPALHDDRPYASYLYLGYRKTLGDQEHGLTLASEIDLGFTGPYSPGSYFQTLVHSTFPTNDEPLGWETQIRTDPVLNYNVSIQQALIQRKNLHLALTASGKLGSLYTQAGTGIRLQAGKQDPYSTRNNGQFYFFLDAQAVLVGYDATLQGGLFSKQNIFILEQDDISRFTGNASAGLHFSYKGYGLEVAQHYLSAEYKGGMPHKWGRMSLVFKL